MTGSSGSTVERWASFVDPEADGPRGNPAGVVPEASGWDDERMLRVAADVGFSETAFVGETAPDGAIALRFFSPTAEVPFCGHATLATAVALRAPDDVAESTSVFRTPAGDVAIRSGVVGEGRGGEAGGWRWASFTSVEPWVGALAPGALGALLGVFGLSADDLDARFPPRVAFAGNPHPILVLADQGRLDALDYDAGALRSLMDAEGWTGTVTVLRALGDGSGEGAGAAFDARNPFPVGAIREDPATGSAAASVGAYVRALGVERGVAVGVGVADHVGVADRVGAISIRQGRRMGRPSALEVTVPAAGGITVRGLVERLA